MRKWFAFNSVDSRTMGLYINKMPEIVRPAERVEYKQVPGRPGSLTFREGENIFDGYDRTITVYHLREQPLDEVLNWLRGTGDLILCNEPDRAYIADLAAEIRFSPVDNDWEQATVSFFCQPYKKQYPPELPIKLTVEDGETTVWNPGNLPSKPVITIPALDSGGSHYIEINEQQYYFSIGDVTVDCEAEIITNSTGLKLDAMDISNGFPALNPGTNVIQRHGFHVKEDDSDEVSDTVTIAPEWRWI